MTHSMKRREATQSHPCPVCQGDHACSIGPDGLIMCRRRTGPQPGFRAIGPAKGDNAWYLYRAEGDPLLRCQTPTPATGHNARQGGEGNGGKTRRIPWTQAAADHAAELTPERAQALADHLRLPLSCLESMEQIGWRRDSRLGKCWTFAERDGNGEVIGLLRRTEGGEKKVLEGSQRGLYLMRGWDEMPGPLYVVEGASDVLALAAMGLAGVGRPFNAGGFQHLAVLLEGFSPTRAIIVLAEIDYKPNGDWPGLTAARQIARALQARLERPVQWALPPDGAKDVRHWITAMISPGTSDEIVRGIGQGFPKRLEIQPADQAVAELPEPDQDAEDHTGLDTVSFEDTACRAVHFLIPAFFARSKIHICAGIGGVGKSRFTYDLAARLSTGQSWAGIVQTDRPPMPVLIANCEDDNEDTIGPCLRAAGADVRAVRWIRAAIAKDGSSLRFSLGNLPAIESHFSRSDKPGFLIIDPVGSFTGGGGFDAFRESDVKALLDPLAELLRKYGWTVLLVMHLNKGSGKKAMDRLMNSVAFGNTARACYGVYYGLEDDDERDLLPMKYNLGSWPKGRHFHFRSCTHQEQDRVGNDLAGKIDPGEWALLAPQLSVLDCWAQTERTAEEANADDDVPQEVAPEDVVRCAHYLDTFLRSGRKTPAECLEHCIQEMGKAFSLRWLRLKVLVGRLHGRFGKTPGVPPVPFWELAD